MRSFREKAGLSADSLASALKVHRNTIYQLERGEQWISSELLEKIAETLRIGPERLFTDAEPRMSAPEALKVLAEAIRKPAPIIDPWLARLSKLTPAQREMLEPAIQVAEETEGVKSKEKRGK